MSREPAIAYLDVAWLVRQALYLIWRLKWPYLLISLILISIAWLSSAPLAQMLARVSPDHADPLARLAQLLILVGTLLPVMFIWFRLLLLGPAQWRNSRSGGAPLWRVFVNLCVVSFGILLALGAIQLIALFGLSRLMAPQWANLAVIIASLFVMARFGPCLPAAATGQELSYLASWRLTARDMWALMAAPFVGSILAIILLILIRTGLRAAGLEGLSYELVGNVALAPLSQLPPILVLSVQAVAWRRLANP